MRFLSQLIAKGHWLIAVALLVFFMGCSSTPSLNPLDWWSGNSAPKLAELPAVKGSATLRLLWQAKMGTAGGVVFSPAVVAGSIYAADRAGNIARYDQSSGHQNWLVNVGRVLSGGVGADSSTAVVGTADGEVIAVDSENGSLRWRVRVSSEVLAAPVIAGDIVLVRSADSRIFALDAKDGRRRWVYQRSASTLAVRSPAGLVVSRGNVYSGFSGGKLVAMSLSTGGVRWEATVSLPRGSNDLDRVTDVVGLPWVLDREICAVAFQGRVACFDITNGNPIWGRDMSSVSGLAADARYLFVSDDGGAIHALDRANGTSIWKQDKLLRRSLTAPLSLGNHIIVADIQGFIHLVSRDSGEFEERISTDGSAVTAAPILIDKGFLVQTRAGGLFVFTN